MEGFPSPREDLIKEICLVFTSAIFIKIWGAVALDAITPDEIDKALKPSSSESEISSFIRKLKKVLASLVLNYVPLDPALHESWTASIFKFETKLSHLSLQRLKHHCSIFFSRHFDESGSGHPISFYPKRNGRQLGTIVCVGDSLTRFFVKTHSFGTKLDTKFTTVADKVNPVEILMYNILYKFGIGCECFVFGKDLRTCYIATLDATSGLDKFDIYDRWEASSHCLGDGLYNGLLNGLSPDKSGEELERLAFADPCSSSFVENILLLHFICRMFSLDDVLTNTENFGFVHNGSANPVLKVVDFTVNSLATKIEALQVGAFLSADITGRYDTSDKACIFCLRYLSPDRCFRIVSGFFETVFKTWEADLTSAAAEVVQQLGCLAGDDMPGITSRINGFVAVIKHNMNLMTTFLAHYEGGGVG